MIKNIYLRRIIKYASVFMAAALVLTGSALFMDKKYAGISFAVAVISCLVFITGFEHRQTGTRRLVIASVMTALAVTGRLFPVVKPMTAVIILAGVYLGGETGFLVGAMTAVISNFYAGQGPWTPFQMLALGIIGFVSGMLGKQLCRKRIILVIYGMAAGIVYSFIMDIWTMLWNCGTFSFSVYIAAIVSAVPVTAVYAFSNGLFLYLLAKPFGDKLQRIKIKYGI